VAENKIIMIMKGDILMEKANADRIGQTKDKPKILPLPIRNIFAILADRIAT
jgi:hypothetical protein